MRNILILLTLAVSLMAKPHIAVSYPYIADITKNIAGSSVDITILASGKNDPHFIVPKPSLIAALRSVDAIIINGAELESGWLHPLLNKAANKKLNLNASTHLDLSKRVTLIDKPHLVDRIVGDVHKDGNPHFHLDPRNTPILADAIFELLVELDGSKKSEYEKNLAAFKSSWQSNLDRWSSAMSAKKGLRVIQYHDIFAYFNRAYGLVNIETIEPYPGLAPSSKHTKKLLDIISSGGADLIVHDVYHNIKTAQYLSSKGGIRIAVVPHDVGSMDSMSSLEAMFDYIVNAIK